MPALCNLALQFDEKGSHICSHHSPGERPSLSCCKDSLPCVSLCISASSHSQTLFQRGLFLLANISGLAAIINEALSGWEGISDPHVSQTQAMSLDPLSFDKPYVTSRMLSCGAHPDPPAQRSLAPQHLVCAVCQPALVSTLPHSLPNLGTVHEATRLYQGGMLPLRWVWQQLLSELWWFDVSKIIWCVCVKSKASLSYVVRSCIEKRKKKRREGRRKGSREAARIKFITSFSSL